MDTETNEPTETYELIETNNELKNTTYEMFIAALSVLSIVNLFIYYLANDPDVEEVVYLIDGLLSLIFLSDFLFRLFTSDSKSGYFLRQYGWADLLASLPIPQAKVLRLFRVARAGRMMRQYGARNLLITFLGNRGGSALLTVLFFMVLVMEFGGMSMLAAERSSPDANIKTAGDSLWYIYVTITTVGYGDRYPVTTAGRLVGVLILTTGIAIFSTLTGFLANAFLAPAKPEETEETSDSAPNVESQPGAQPATLAEIQALFAQQQHAQAALQNKIAELEQLLVKSKAERG